LKEQLVFERNARLVPLRRSGLTLAACLPLAIAAIAGSPTALHAQSGQAATREPSNEQLLEDFTHNTLIDSPSLAAQWGEALLAKNLDPTEFVKLVESSRGGVSKFERAIIQALRYRDLESTAGKLLRLFEDGKRAIVRDPEAIAKSIADLTGTQRARSYARERLKAAGEYALPQLLRALIQRENGILQAEVRTLLVDMGRHSLVPLTTALGELDPVSQETVINVLRDIPYSASIPFIYDVRASTQVDAVRTAAEEAIRKIAGAINDGAPLASRYEAVGNEYYSESLSLTSFPGEPNQLWWTYDPGAGLLFDPIDTSVFHEAMAMRHAERALQLDSGNAGAISLWLASNFSREIDGPEGYSNPAYSSDRREAMYYAVAAGNAPSQRVLGRALDTNDTPLARKAIAAIEKTAGGAQLWSNAERRALLEALRYPSRRVQYEAAIALGAAGPRESFEASDRVVPLLGSAIRDAGARYALVIAATAEQQTALGDILRARGYKDVRPASQLVDVEQAIADMPGVDLILTDLTTNATQAMIAEARGRAKLRAAPIMALASSAGYQELAQKYSDDPTIRIGRIGMNQAEIGEASEQLLGRAIGGAISDTEAAEYKTRAIAVLRDLAVSGNSVLNVTDASGPLITALNDNRGAMRQQIAEVLAFVNTPAAQQALMDAALAAAGEERVMLLGKVAGSAKRSGNLLESRHITALREIVTTGENAEATAAAALMGALNLPNAELVPLILGRKEVGAR
jgi:hypothetical protein